MSDPDSIFRPEFAREPSPVTAGTISRDMVIKAMRTLMTPRYQPEIEWMHPDEYERRYGPLRTVPAQRGAGDA